MVERNDIAQRLPECRAALNVLRDEFVEHVKAIHPRAIPSISCHPCMNYKWRIEWQKFLIRDLEARVSNPLGNPNNPQQ